MNLIQVIILILLGAFYLAYLLKALMLKRRGIAVNLLGKGDKPKAARRVEDSLRVVTLVGAVVQSGSVILLDVVWVWPVNMPVIASGVVLLICGNLFFISAMLTMRDNWRAGFDRNQNTNLVTQGVYSISRNPAFVGFDFIYIGCAMMFPNIVNITVTVMAMILFHIQILGEEKYCAEAFGQEYLEYREKTMRYIGKSCR